MLPQFQSTVLYCSSLLRNKNILNDEVLFDFPSTQKLSIGHGSANEICINLSHTSRFSVCSDLVAALIYYIPYSKIGGSIPAV